VIDPDQIVGREGGVCMTNQIISVKIAKGGEVWGVGVRDRENKPHVRRI
jgi:hypothetical protein